MKIGLYNIDSKIANLALMKISAYHKKKGDSVAFCRPIEFELFDKIYASSIFSYSDKSYVYKNDKVVCGGTGFDVEKKLPDEIEECEPDYSIYPHCNYSIQYFSRGCIRKCGFCIVREKEGFIKPVKPMKLNPKGKWIEIFDNNFFANPDWKDAIKIIQGYDQPVMFRGVDARLLTIEMAECLLSLRHEKQIYMAWDDPNDDIDWEKILKWIPANKIMVYILIGYFSDYVTENDKYRINRLRELGIDMFPLCYIPQTGKLPNKMLKEFARYVIMKRFFKKMSFEEFKLIRANNKNVFSKHSMMKIPGF